MPSVERQRDRGARRARNLALSVGQELLEARVTAGLSQESVARAAGLHQSRVSRTERADSPMARIDELARHCAVLGLQLSVRPFPDGPAVRDAAQLKLIAVLRAMVSPRFRWRTEVPIGIEGDHRAWDVVLDGPGTVVIEAETRLRDMQALQRRLELKLRDSGSPRLVLVVADTHHNRRVVHEFRTALASTLPLDTRPVLQALRASVLPSDNGIALIRS